VPGRFERRSRLGPPARRSPRWPGQTRQLDIFLVRNPRKRLNRAEALFAEQLEHEIAQTPLAERTYSD